MSRNIPSFPNPQIELHCRIDGSMLGPLREFICGIARQLGFAEPQVAEIEICVDEACANVLEHAYVQEFLREFPADDKNLRVEIGFSANELTVRVIDFGKGCAGTIDERIRNLEEYLSAGGQDYRGLGLLLIRKYMDRVDVRKTPGNGTTVEMIKIRRSA
jgi:serine/threonine-protein kinase RsbW